MKNYLASSALISQPYLKVWLIFLQKSEFSIENPCPGYTASELVTLAASNLLSIFIRLSKLFYNPAWAHSSSHASCNAFTSSI